jgi:hypothetical protein
MFKKEKKPFIKFISTIDGLDQIEECVPKLATKYIPEWFKNVPATKDYLITKTVRLCPSFPDLFSSAYVIPAWEDCVLKYDKNSDRWSTKNAGLTEWTIHSTDQFLEYTEASIQGLEADIVFKATCPWRIITPPGYSVLQLPMFYHFNKQWTTLPGIIDTDIHHEINQQILYHANGEEVRIARGTPLAMYIPYKRNKFNIFTNFMTPKEKKLFDSTELRYKGRLFSKGIYRDLQKQRDKE